MADTETPSRQVLDETPGRALKMLSGLSTNHTIRGYLAGRGYTDTDHDEGWGLVLTVGGYRKPASGIAPPVMNVEARNAITELDAWDEPNFRVARAALERRHPDQAAFVFDNLSASVGAGAVVGVSTFLDRLDELESGAGRKKTRKADHAALDTMAKRGITPAERTRLRALVTTARSSEGADYVEPEPQTPAPQAPVATDVDRIALYRWYREWSETARAVIQRRDYLIVLGLAKRKAPKKKP